MSIKISAMIIKIYVTFIYFLSYYSVLCSATTSTDRVVCYYASWQGQASVKPENLDAKLCTHLNYAFATIHTNGSLKAKMPNLDIGKDLYKRVTNLKHKNTKLKVLLSIQGAHTLFSKIAGSNKKRKHFVESAKDFMRTYDFDGIDIDWEIPLKDDRENFIKLLSELKAEFEKFHWLLSAAVRSFPSDGYDAVELNRILTFINVMSYDFYGPWSAYTGHNSALYASTMESKWEKSHLNIDVSIKNWKDAGASPEQLNIGLAFYGRSYKLKDPNQHGVKAPFSGRGVSNGVLGYYEICGDFKNWTKVWDEEQETPYMYSNDQWVSYDDEKSIREKANFIADQNVGGIMIWHIGADDVFGSCGPKQNLLRIVNKRLGRINSTVL